MTSLWTSMTFLLLGIISTSPQAQATRKIAPSPAQECQKSYERFFAKYTIDIRIIFGYKDTRPARFVGDRYERIALVEALQKPCFSNRFDCGFWRSRTDADLLEKEILGPNQRKHRIEIRITSSAAGPDDQENTHDPLQTWKSNEAKRVFLEGLKDADAVFYDGHSRDGGGPDFFPPRLDKNGHVAYQWYKTHKPGLKEMQQEIRKTHTLAKLIGLYSCVSNHLVPEHKKSMRTAWITYHKLFYFADALQSMKDSLSALLGSKCRKDFARVLQNHDRKKLTKNLTTSLSGFF